MPAPAGLIAIVGGLGASFTATTVVAVNGTSIGQTVGPSTDVLQYGATGVLGLSFLALLTAVAQGRFVSKDVGQLLEQGAERERKLLDLVSDSSRRETALLEVLVQRATAARDDSA